MPPIKSAGAKMPPAPPLEYEVTVAASFSTHNAIIAVTGIVPLKACVKVLYGSPAMPPK